MDRLAGLLEHPSVERACYRAAVLADLEAKRGLSTVASVASKAPLLGFLATTLTIPSCFPGFTGDAWVNMFAIMERLAASLLPSAFGILVGVLARWIHGYLIEEADSLHFEAANVAFFLVQYDAGRSHGRWARGWGSPSM